MADPEILERGRKTIYQLRNQLSQMHTTNYCAFDAGKGGLLTNILSQWGTAPIPPLNPPLIIDDHRDTVIPTMPSLMCHIQQEMQIMYTHTHTHSLSLSLFLWTLH